MSQYRPQQPISLHYGLSRQELQCPMLYRYQRPNEADGTRGVANPVPRVWVPHHYFIDISFTGLKRGRYRSEPC